MKKTSSGSHGASTDHHSRYEHQYKEIIHFGHCHFLHQYKLLKEDERICEICSTDVVGSCYGCGDCDFFIHESCHKLPREIKHKSHHSHYLTLRSIPSYKSCQFMCDACRKTHNGFHYHCSTCSYDLHVACAGTPSTVKYHEHEHPLQLYYDFPIEGGKFKYCSKCDTKIDRRAWVYYCRNKKIIAHINCAFDQTQEDNATLVLQELLQSLQM